MISIQHIRSAPSVRKLFVSILFLFALPTILSAQSLDELDSYSVDEFYQKIELDYGTLDQQGNLIDFVFVKTTLDPGTYEVDLTDGPGDLYEIKGTEIFIDFRGYESFPKNRSN